MDAAAEQALAIDRDSSAAERTVDITTTGRHSGEPRRIETWFYRVDGTIYLSGAPGRRGWAANLEADPAFTFHLKNGLEADLSAHAGQITDEAERRAILTTLLDEISGVTSVRRDLEEWVARSPLFAVQFD
jgi:F420H(2)-dependent quinone reductase